ncbi:caffeine-induced death protein 2-domain-containing protein [Hysterangium stoloniferum]|nr:caffeine-induced death protein 2-domain-containing protein [Hysterangium stoloniferum]
MPPSRTPELGSQAFYFPSSTASQVVRVTPTTCHNLSTFKDLIREYRRLDDAVTMRLNRNIAQFRDRDRSAHGASSSADESCAYFWSQLVAGWKARTEMIKYCVNVVDTGMEEKREAFATLKDGLGKDGESEEKRRAERKEKAVLYAEEVKKNQIHNELSVERIVRIRAFEAFQSRCKYFEPPKTDSEARRWWDAALSNQ